MIDIIIDDREAGIGVVDIMRNIDGISSQVKRLAVGDYEIDGRLLVERKTLIDLAQSLKDGRLFSQASRLVAAPQRGIMIIEGVASDLAASKMRREALQGALISLTVYFGLSVLRSRDLHETVQLMVYAAQQGHAIASGALPRHGKRPRGKRRAQLHILQGLPGIGPDRAQALLTYFGSVESVFGASEQELETVGGIGVTTANKIRWAVSEPIMEYTVNTSKAGFNLDG